jgi:outer membrane PBP1 activator LpoA protein
MLRSAIWLLLAALLLAGCGAMPSREQPPARAQEAERLFSEGEFAAAAQAFLDAASERRSLRDYYRLRAAEAWREQGDLAQAGRQIEGLATRRLGPDEILRLNLLRAELALERGDADQLAPGCCGFGRCL